MKIKDIEKVSDEQAIQELTKDWPLEDLDTPNKIKTWLEKE
ncbi:hypothetical protein [Lactobacillus sp. LL6]|nr:hypothetical protein [Lactobacillus sp. LL6]